MVSAQVGDYPGTERAATIALKQFDQLRGRGDGMWRDQGINDLPWLKRAHQNVFDILCEAHKRLAYECWKVESKLKRLPRRKKRGPKHVGYQFHVRQAMAVADAGKGRLMLDSFDGCENDTTGTLADWDKLEEGIELRGKVQQPLPPPKRLVSPTLKKDRPPHVPLKPINPEETGDVSKVVYICFELPKAVDDVGIDPLTKHMPESQLHQKAVSSKSSQGALFVACGEEVHMLSFDADAVLASIAPLRASVEAEITSIDQKRVAMRRRRYPKPDAFQDTDSEYEDESVTESENEEDWEDLEPKQRAAMVAAREERHAAAVRYPQADIPLKVCIVCGFSASLQ